MKSVARAMAAHTCSRFTAADADFWLLRIIPIKTSETTQADFFCIDKSFHRKHDDQSRSIDSKRLNYRHYGVTSSFPSNLHPPKPVLTGYSQDLSKMMNSELSKCMLMIKKPVSPSTSTEISRAGKFQMKLPLAPAG